MNAVSRGRLSAVGVRTEREVRPLCTGQFDSTPRDEYLTSITRSEPLTAPRAKPRSDNLRVGKGNGDKGSTIAVSNMSGATGWKVQA